MGRVKELYMDLIENAERQLLADSNESDFRVRLKDLGFTDEDIDIRLDVWRGHAKEDV